jgi:tRNA threonylcarbamoyladenosine modification (KEOPS) complex  Pcc1 subunit
LKEQRVSIRIIITLDKFSPEISSAIGNAISTAVKPETKFLTGDEKITITSKNGVISLNISSNDLQSIRAIVNAYIRLLSLSYLSLNL